MLGLSDGVIVCQHHLELGGVGALAVQDVLTGTRVRLGDENIACCMGWEGGESLLEPWCMAGMHGGGAWHIFSEPLSQ